MITRLFLASICISLLSCQFSSNNFDCVDEFESAKRVIDNIHQDWLNNELGSVITIFDKIGDGKLGDLTTKEFFERQQKDLGTPIKIEAWAERYVRIIRPDTALQVEFVHLVHFKEHRLQYTYVLRRANVSAEYEVAGLHIDPVK